MEDDGPSTDIRARRNFGTKIKEICANTVHSCHAKYRTALSLTPFWRISISVNDEPENLMILPPIDESLTDKLIILKAMRHPMPMPTVSDEERSQFMNALKAELPHFAYFLFNWRIPEPLISQRYGITHYRHAEILTGARNKTARTHRRGTLRLVSRRIMAGDRIGVREEANIR